MNKCFPALLVPLAALVLAGSALAQTESSRISRACTKSTLSTNPAAPCSDDVLNDGRGDILIFTRPPPANSPGNTGGSLSTGAVPALQPGADVTGVGPGAPANTPGAAATGTSLTGTGAASTGGAAGMTGRR